MMAKLPVSIVVLAMVGVVCVAGVWAQQTPPATPAPAPAEGAAATGEAVTDDPGADAGGADEGGANAAQRRRLMMTTTAQLKIGDKSIGLSTGVLKTDGPDYAAIASLKEGDVVLLTRSQSIKLKTDLPLTLGDVTLKTENVSQGYAGVYALWVKKTADGWQFAFTEKPDLWGTMYAAADVVAEVPATYTKLAAPTDALKFELPQSGQGGTIKLSWGEHEWSAPFTIAN